MLEFTQSLCLLTTLTTTRRSPWNQPCNLIQALRYHFYLSPKAIDPLPVIPATSETLRYATDTAIPILVHIIRSSFRLGLFLDLPLVPEPCLGKDPNTC